MLSIPPDNNTLDNTATLTIPVTETIPPVALCKPVTVNLNSTGNASITAAQVNNGSSDNCSNISLSVSPSTFTCANIGINNVTLTATDVSGNTATCTAAVTIRDITPPSFTNCPSPPASYCAGITGKYVITGTGWNATAGDNCAVSTLTYTLTGATSGTGTSLDGVTLNPGLTTITWTASDASNNQNTCSFSVTVYPFPSVTATPSGQNICSGSPTSIVLTGNVTGMSFTWTAAIQTSPSGGTITGQSNCNSGCGTSIAQTLTNNGTSAGVVRYTITPSANGCTGTPITIDVVVNPLPATSPIFHR